MPERMIKNEALTALHKAAQAISQNLELDKVLQQIVDEARRLVHAKYAALGVPNDTGQLETFIQSGMTTDQVALLPTMPHGHGLLGAIIKEKRPLRTPKISQHKYSTGFPANHPPMESFLGVPIWSGHEVIGNLYLAEKIDADEFSAADQELIEMMAVHAAVAIQNARLYEQVERLAIIEERTRIGMDLHDGVIQAIYAVGLTLESARLAHQDGDTDIEPLLDIVAKGLNDAIRDIRNYILDLRPRRFSGDLGEGMRMLVREFQANTLIPVQLKVPYGLTRLSPKVARTLFLTTQEGLANIARHAEANAVQVSLYWQNGDIALEIEDDGRGFDLKDKKRRVGHGLANMPTRAKKLSGEFALTTAVGEGTNIKMTLPATAGT